jgi:hypothetical protein
MGASVDPRNAAADIHVNLHRVENTSKPGTLCFGFAHVSFSVLLKYAYISTSTATDGAIFPHLILLIFQKMKAHLETYQILV